MGKGGYHGDRKAYSTRRHTMEMPLSEGEGLEDEDGDTTTNFVCVGEHGRQGLSLGGHDPAGAGVNHQRPAASSPQHRGGSHHPKEVMRKLALSERRDSFKKQEAVQELNFDLEEVEETASLKPEAFTASWINPSPAESRGSMDGVGAQQKAKSKGKEGF